MSQNGENTKKKKVIVGLSISTRADILKRLDDGELSVNLAADFNVTRSAISRIKKNRAQILQALDDLAGCEGDQNKKRYRGTETKLLDKQLYEWFCQNRAKGLPLSGPILKKQAIFFNQRIGGPDSFRASDGWLDRFKKRHSIAGQLAKPSKKIPVDPAASEEFKEFLANIIKVTGLSLDNIYNCNETGLYWKLLPNKTPVRRSGKMGTDPKKAKDRVTVLLCTNASGTHKIPLLLIGKSREPECFKGVSSLPVVYSHQQAAWMDKDIMDNWYSTVFIPEVTRFHHLENDYEKKIILIMDNASCHVFPSAGTASQSCSVMYFPPNVTSLIQPLDQGIIEQFKRSYKSLLLSRFLTEKDDFFKSFTLLDCCIFCAMAWDEVLPNTIRNCWKKLIPLETDSFWDVESVSINAVHSLVTRFQGLEDLSLVHTKKWLEADADEIGWQPSTGEEGLQLSPIDGSSANVTENPKLDQSIENQECNDDEPSLRDLYNTSKKLLSMYQKYKKNNPEILKSLRDCHKVFLEELARNN